jgi:hypothetical protein
MTKTNETIVDASSVSINVKINELILKREKWDKVYHTAQLGLYAILHGCFEAFKEYQTSSADNKTVIKEELNVRHLKTESPIKTDDVATMIIGCVFETALLSKDQRFNYVNTIKRADADGTFTVATSEEDFIDWVDQNGGTHNIARRKPLTDEEIAKKEEASKASKAKQVDEQFEVEKFCEISLKEQTYVVSENDFSPTVSTGQLAVVLGRKTDDGFELCDELVFQHADIIEAVKKAIWKERKEAIQLKNASKKKEADEGKEEAETNQLKEQGTPVSILINDEYLAGLPKASTETLTNQV